ncbi:MAG: GNAT family N-acetyltransferase [Bdellovibrionaceae bacterium]|jgi:[ribosomal protein S5]-alanine N-acetyltransferase|nr:GNAT family N-acetyltransferase [Pseudobdellovibrionaceae bacterium]
MKHNNSILYNKIHTQSKRLLMRPYKLTDFTRCMVSKSNRLSKVSVFDEEISTLSGNTYSEFKQRVEMQRKHGKMRVHFVLALFDKKSDEFVGQIDLFVINKQLRWVNLGYQIHNQYWGKGFATEAAFLAQKLAFTQLDVYRVEAATELKNKAAIKVAKKSGMLYEGKRIKFFPDNGGVDMVVYGANAIDFKYVI